MQFLSLLTPLAALLFAHAALAASGAVVDLTDAKKFDSLVGKTQVRLSIFRNVLCRALH